MSSLPDVWLHSVHYCVFHETNCLSNQHTIIKTLHLIREAFTRINFDFITIKYLDRYTPSNLKPLNRNWTNIEKKIKEGRIQSLVYGVLNPSGYNFKLGVAFTLYNERTRKVDTASGHYDHVDLMVDRSAFEDNFVSFQECESLLKTIWKTVNGVYGYGDYFISNPKGIWIDQKRLTVAQEFGAKVETVERTLPREDLHIEIPEIYWLNLLNHNHVKRLHEHGISKTDLAQFITEELAYGGLAIRPSETPFMAKEPNFASSKDQLRKILMPLLAR